MNGACFLFIYRFTQFKRLYTTDVGVICPLPIVAAAIYLGQNLHTVTQTSACRHNYNLFVNRGRIQMLFNYSMSFSAENIVQ